MGENNWSKVDPSPLYGAARVVIIGDRDKIGSRFISDVYTSLKAHVGKIDVKLSALGKDSADHVAADLGIEDFVSVGANLLEDVEAFLRRFVAYPSEHGRIAHALWIAHTHLMDAWDSTPRIAFLSPEPGSGKTRAIEVTELLVPNPVEAVNVTPAYLFRKVGMDSPTIL